MKKANTFGALAGVALAGSLMAPMGATEPAAFEAKLERVRSGASPGEVVFFSSREINEWAARQTRAKIPSGVRDPFVRPGPGTVALSAKVDIPEAARSLGRPLSTLDALGLKVLGLDREQPMTVRLRVRSSNGTATAYLTAVEINGRAIPDVARDKLAQMLAKSSSKAALGRPIDLPADINRISLAPDGARVHLAGELVVEPATTRTRAAAVPAPAAQPRPSPAEPPPSKAPPLNAAPAAPAMRPVAAPAAPSPFEPRRGAIAWSGRVRRGQVIEIDAETASAGELRGALPGFPVELRYPPGSLVLESAPSASNGWKSMKLRAFKGGWMGLAIRWTEIRPYSADQDAVAASSRARK